MKNKFTAGLKYLLHFGKQICCKQVLDAIARVKLRTLLNAVDNSRGLLFQIKILEAEAFKNEK